jgi:iron(III) transport system substrate-binding protein
MSASGSEPQKSRRWWNDPFAKDEVLVQLGCIWFPLVLPVLLTLLFYVVSSGQNQSRLVIVYAAQDQVYAEPILRQFTKETGIKVRAVYDSEAVKTVGLANRLMAERSRPQCDVFWGNEELRTRQLAAAGVFRETNGWTAFGYRSRRVAVGQLAEGSLPHSLLELTNAAWRGRVSLAYPLFGTTATHFLALRQLWGASRWEAWCRALAANQPFLEEGNSLVVKRLARGEAWIGLTDSDDLGAARREQLDVGTTLPLNAESLLIPNTVAVIRGAPHPATAQQLFEFLQRREVVAQLAAAEALEGVDPRDVPTPTLEPDWDALLRDLDSATTRLKEIFLR